MNLKENQIGSEGISHLSQLLREQPQVLQSLITLNLQTKLFRRAKGMSHISQALHQEELDF